MDKIQKPAILSIIHHCQNPLESTWHVMPCSLTGAGTNIFVEHAASISRQKIHLKPWYLSTKQYGIRSHKTIILMLTAARIPDSVQY
jgi:hypothetical protein